MRARTRIAATSLFTLCGAIACAPGAPSRTLYQWTDSSGNVRYTPFPARIPRSQRDAAQPVARGNEHAQTAYWGAQTSMDELFAEPDDLTSVEFEAALPKVEAAWPESAEVEAPALELLEVEAALPEPVEVEVALPELLEPEFVPTLEASQDARIQELEAAIARDQEALKQLLGDPESAAGLRASPELREISERLPQLQVELQSLLEQRELGDDGG